jgi:hypothetical protein
MNFWLIVLLALAGSYLVANLMMALLFIVIGRAMGGVISADAERKE